MIECVKVGFQQEDFEMYATCEQLIIKAAQKEDHSAELDSVTTFYDDDFTPNILNTQLQTLPFTLPDLHDATTFQYLPL